jgi:hypothetical protein
MGRIAMGYGASSSSVLPDIRHTGRLVTDALGTLQTESTLLTGGGSQLANLSRWGDHASLSVGPGDDCTVWYATEYLKSSGTFNWSTRIASFGSPAAPDPLTRDPARVMRGASRVTLVRGLAGVARGLGGEYLHGSPRPAGPTRGDGDE